MNLHQPVIRIETTIPSISSTIDRTENQCILDWASEIPYQKHFKSAREKALAGTGEWLFRDPEFSAWQNCSRSQMLWLHGNAGSGKSTLISMVIQSLIETHVQQQAAYPIYFFCSRNTAEPERSDPEHILRSLMRQASDLPGGPPLHQILKDRFKKHRVEGEVSAEEASEVIINTIESRPITYIMIDALDECDRQKREILVDALKAILTQSNSLVKIFVTSKDNHQDIVWSMNGSPALCIDASRNRADIVQYVQYSVQRAIDKRKLLPTERMTADMQRVIVDSLCDGADGMFRWVELQLELLYTIRKKSVLLERLKKLPPGLEKIYRELYEYNIQELGEEQAEIVKKILSWLLVAKVPLRTSQLCQLVCAPDEPDMSIETVLDMTFDLIRLDTQQDQFRFSHLSVREFLEKKEAEFGQGLLHSMATCTCLTLLTSLETINTIDYAALYWLAHAEDATRKGSRTTIKQQLDGFLSTKNSHFRRWNSELFHRLEGLKRGEKTSIEKRRRMVPTEWRRRMIPMEKRLSPAIVESGSPLLIAACFDRSTQLQRIISDADQPIDIVLKNEDGAGALYLASSCGAVESARVLLDSGADVNAVEEDAETALHAASRAGDEKIVQMLLNRGANVNAPAGRLLHTALQLASFKGHEEIVQILLHKGADVNAQGGDCGGALQAASSRGHEKIVHVLLDKGANVNAEGKFDSALQTASRAGHEKIVQMLLDAGADINMNRGFWGSPLQAASIRGHKNIVRLLLDVGADFNVEEGFYGSPLHAASLQGNEKLVQLLLDVGMDVNARGRGFFGTALHAASYGGHEKIVQILLDRGADINAKDGGGTALQTASNNKKKKVVQILRQHGAKENAKEGESKDG